MKKNRALTRIQWHQFILFLFWWLFFFTYKSNIYIINFLWIYTHTPLKIHEEDLTVCKIWTWKKSSNYSIPQTRVEMRLCSGHSLCNHCMNQFIVKFCSQRSFTIPILNVECWNRSEILEVDNYSAALETVIDWKFTGENVEK